MNRESGIWVWNICGMILAKHPSTRKKPVPVTLRPPQIPHGSDMPAINRMNYSTVIKDFKNVIGRHILPRNVLLL